MFRKCRYSWLSLIKLTFKNANRDFNVLTVCHLRFIVWGKFGIAPISEPIDRRRRTSQWKEFASDQHDKLPKQMFIFWQNSPTTTYLIRERMSFSNIFCSSSSPVYNFIPSDASCIASRRSVTKQCCRWHLLLCCSSNKNRLQSLTMSVIHHAIPSVFDSFPYTHSMWELPFELTHDSDRVIINVTPFSDPVAHETVLDRHQLSSSRYVGPASVYQS